MISTQTAVERGAPKPLALTSALLVDDSSADRRAVARMLNAHGVGDVLEADSAFEAYTLLKSNRVDLILIDVVMPSIGGIKLLRAVRKTTATAAVPIIMMTASRDAGHLQDARAAWADGYLLKPFTSDSLRAMITAATRGKGFVGLDAEDKGEAQARKEPGEEQPRRAGPTRVSRFFRGN